MPRPRDPNVPVQAATCSVHGPVLLRRHKIGVRNGVQRYRYRCPQCHTEKMTRTP